MSSEEIIPEGVCYALLGEPRPPLHNGIRLNFVSGDGKGYLIIEVGDCRTSVNCTVNIGNEYRRTTLGKTELLALGEALLKTARDMEYEE